MAESDSTLSDFSGTARLFPLPNLVLYPHVVQLLHIFEPRYKQMTADALAGDKLIALATLAPGWEDEYDDRPAVHPVACLGKVVAEQKLSDGRYNLMLRGVARVRVVEECDDEDKPYRLARVEVLEDEPVDSLEEATRLRRELSDEVLPRFSGEGPRKQLTELFQSEMALGPLCDVLAFALPLPLECKQGLLEEVSVAQRAALLVQSVCALTAPRPHSNRKFPPDFSAN